MSMKRIIWLRERIQEQKNWIDRCGGSLSGYIEHYGDPGIPPLQNGMPKILTIPAASHYLCTDLVRVPDTTDQFYAPHYGNGGTAIYEADYNRLQSLQNDLNEAESRRPLGAKL